MDPTQPLDPKIHARRWFTLATLCLSLVIIVMDNTILNVAIPSLVRELGATNSQLQWIIDGYTLVFAGLLLTMGSLGDRFGRKKALTIGIALFGVGSAASALAVNPLMLIATRSFMGIGGALIMPSTLSILANVFRDPRERGRAIAIWAAFSGVGVALGPIAGGLLLDHFSWHSVFWLNVPVGVLALTAGRFFVPESKDMSAPRLDPAGALLSIVALGSLLFAIIEGPSRGWSDTLVVVGFAVGAVALAMFVWWELHSDHPMLDLAFFRNPRFSAANIAVTMTFFALFGSMFLMTQYWQFVHGYSPLAAGVRTLPYAMSMMVFAPLSARLVERFGTKRVVAFGLTVVAVALVGLSTIEVDSSYLRVIVTMCIMASGMGLTTAPATESVMGSLPREKAGVGSAVNDTTRQMGGAMGVAIIGTIVASSYSAGVDKVSARMGVPSAIATSARESLGSALKAAPELGDRAAEFVHSADVAFVDALSRGFMLGAVVLAIAAAIVLRFLPSRAHDHVEWRDDDTIDAARVTSELSATAGS